MKIHDSFVALGRVKEAMGATNTAWAPRSAGLEPREQLRRRLVEGIEIELSNVQSAGALPLLTYEGEQVLLYIRDTRASRDELLYEPENTRRYHVAECSTLQEMRHAGRFQRYVVAQDTSGLFLCDWVNQAGQVGGQERAALKVCKNCLKELSWKGYPKGNKASIWGDFDIADFLFEHATLFLAKPSRTANSALQDQYPADWAQISTRFREQSGWACGDCGVILREYPQLLHCHHINGVRGDTAPKNLESVCMECHSKKPMHSHMKVPLHHLRTIEKLRRAQALIK